MFEIGQKVVCITGNPGKWNDHGKGYPKQPLPKKGDIFKIIDISSFRDLVFLAFEKYGFVFGFESSNFKPLDYEFVEEVFEQVRPKELV